VTYVRVIQAQQVHAWVQSGYSIDRALIQSSPGKGGGEGRASCGGAGSLLGSVAAFPLLGQTRQERDLDGAWEALDSLGVAEAVTRGWDSPITQSAVSRALSAAPSTCSWGEEGEEVVQMIQSSGSRLQQTWWSP
jgi:hypothetical protein